MAVMQDLANAQGSVIQKQRRVTYTDIDLDRLVHWEGNPDNRNRNDEVFRDLVDSLTEKGQLQPVTVYPQIDGTYLLVDGNRRARAAQALGWTKLRAAIHHEGDPTNPMDDVIQINLNQKPWRSKDMLEASGTIGVEEVVSRVPSRFRKTLQRMANGLTPEEFRLVTANLGIESYSLALRVARYIGWSDEDTPTIIRWFANHPQKYGRGVTYPVRVAIRTDYPPEKLEQAITNNTTLW